MAIMDSTAYVAIVTALATLLGAISPIIVALIQANKDKVQTKGILLPSHVVLHRPKTQIRWLTVLAFALLGSILGYVGAKISDIVIEKQQLESQFSSALVP